MNWFDKWWNGSDLLGFIIPILFVIGLAIPVGIIYVIWHFVSKYW